MTAPETRVQIRRWFVETGYVDGNGIGLWDQTEESVEVASQAEAEALRDAWEASGKLERTKWGELRLRSPYGAFRIRNIWEDAAAALAARDETVLAMVAAAYISAEIAVGSVDPQNEDDATTQQIAEIEAIRLLTPADAAAALAARDKRIRDEALEEAAKVAWDAANTSNADAENAHQRGMSEGAFHLRQEAEAFARVAVAIRALKGDKP